MRPLYLDKHGTPCLEKFSSDKTPPYAILSHTWGSDDSEVTYEDVSKCTTKSKALAGIKKYLSDTAYIGEGQKDLLYMSVEQNVLELQFSWY